MQVSHYAYKHMHYTRDKTLETKHKRKANAKLVRGDFILLLDKENKGCQSCAKSDLLVVARHGR